MDELKGLFGEDGTGTIDFATFCAGLEKSGIKLADINKGEYVSKAKYEKTVNDFAKYKTENSADKYADYETMKAENEALKAEKAENAMLEDVAKKSVDERFRRFVMCEAKALVTDKVDFATALDGYLKENPQYIATATAPMKGRGVVRIGTSGELEKGKGGGTKTTNEKMNTIIRRVIK